MKTVIDLATALKTYFTGKDTAAKQAVEANIAPVETDASSSAAPYSVGDQLILNDILYDVTASISISDALVVGTNIAAASDLSTQIGGKQDQIEVTSMPTASASNVGQVLIYIGATTSTYTSGQSYQSTYEGGAYIWKPAPTAEAVSYDGTQSGSSETDVQGAIDDLYSQNQTLTSAFTNNVNQNGCKNILPNDAYSQTLANVSVSVNDNGEITVSGTANDTFKLYIHSFEDFLNDFLELNKDYVFSSGIPYNETTANITLKIMQTSGGSWMYIVNGDTFKLTSTPYRIEVVWWASSGTVLSGTCKPMICLKSDYDLDPTYEPYAKTNQQLTQDTTGLLDNLEVNGAVNMLPNTATTQTINGVTFTVNSDGTVTANGTATANAVLKISDRFTLADYIGRKYVDAKKNEASSSTYSLIITYRNGSGAYVNETYVPTEGFILSTISNATLVELGIFVKSGQSVSNLTFKPMITVASYNGDYVPYAKSNKELTQDTTGLLDNTEVNGAVNIAPFDGTSQLINGVNVTFNTNGSITADGANQDKKATANIRLHIGYFTLRKGIVYKVSANEDGSIYSKKPGRCIAVRQKSDSSWKMSTDKDGYNSAYYRPLADVEMEIILAINTDLYVDNLTFYPMVTVSSYNGPYVPYAKSNKELTDDIGNAFLKANSYCFNCGANTSDIDAYGRSLGITASTSFDQLIALVRNNNKYTASRIMITTNDANLTSSAPQFLQDLCGIFSITACSQLIFDVKIVDTYYSASNKRVEITVTDKNLSYMKVARIANGTATIKTIALS